MSIQIEPRKQRRPTFDTREEAEAWLEERQRERRERLILGGITPKPLGFVTSAYLGDRTTKGKRTVEGDRALLERHLIPFFGATTLVTKISAQRIGEYARQLATTVHPRLGRPVTAATINRHLSVLRCLLRLAKKWSYLRDVPVFEMAKEPEGRRRYLVRHEITRLVEVCRQSRNPYLWRIVVVALHTGMRLGEILSLEWSRVDFARCVLLLEQTKSGRRREVPMDRAVYDALIALPRPKDGGRVFQKAKGEAWGRIDTGFKTALKRAGISNFRFHDLRHTFASWLVMDGASLMEVRDLLGHTTITMTLRYSHLAPERLREAVSRLDRVFGVEDGQLAEMTGSLQSR